MAARLFLRVLRVTGAVVVLVVAAIALVCGLVVLQGQRDEARPADALLLSYTAPLPPERLSQIVDLYRRGYAPRLILASDDPTAALEGLRRQGIPEDTLLVVSGPAGGTLTRLQGAAGVARQRSIASIVIADEPSNLLLSLKIAHDLGLKAYGSPAASGHADLGTTLRAGLDYWGYVLLGQA